MSSSARRVSSAAGAWRHHGAAAELGASGRTFSDSLVTGLDAGINDESDFVADYITPQMNFMVKSESVLTIIH